MAFGGMQAKGSGERRGEFVLLHLDMNAREGLRERPAEISWVGQEGVRLEGVGSGGGFWGSLGTIYPVRWREWPARASQRRKGVVDRVLGTSDGEQAVNARFADMRGKVTSGANVPF
jgi:hypothetical protein